MFLLFINDIGDDIGSSIKLFADDCLLFWTISSTEDTTKLQKDLNTLHEWSSCWQMKFNAKKCYTMSSQRGKHPITYIPTITPWEEKSSVRYPAKPTCTWGLKFISA